MEEKKRQTSSRTSLTSLDVARRAGVSRTSVSYVLNENGRRNAHVSEATRAKVLQAAQELGYSPQSSARALRRGRSEEICVIADLPLSVHRTELLISLQQHAFLHGYLPVVYFSHSLSFEQVRELLLKIFARRPMGIFATSNSMTADNVALAKRMGMNNIVLYSVKPIEYTHAIILPTMEAGYLAAQHLLERGHRHLGLVRPVDPLHDYGFLQRCKGMCSAIATVPGAILDILPLPFSLYDAYSVVDNYLTGAHHPTGIYAFNDEYAMLLLGALADRHIRVPETVAVVGTDDISFAEIMRPTLTSIRFDTLSLGQRVVEMLIAAYEDKPFRQELSLPLVPQLVPRASS